MNILSDFLRWCPGAVGLLLRQKVYPHLLKQCGRKVLFGRFVSLQGHKKISVGDGVVINDYAFINAEKYTGAGTGILIEDGVFIGAGTKIQCSDQEIVIRKKANLGSECRITADRKIVIGENVLLAAYCNIGASNAGAMNASKEDNNTVRESVTTIGDGCWLGVRTCFCSGLEVGEETVIGAHAIVKHGLPAKIVAVGNPAEVHSLRGSS
jgi:acetyltransferase-like isoleucine patch superfamily enzyme